MAKTTIFISSTFADLSGTRKAVGDDLRRAGHAPVLFEDGSLSYDSRAPLEVSGYEQVKRSQILVLIIGRRYGSSAADPTNTLTRGDYISITRKEYQTAREAGIPIFTFVLKDLERDAEAYVAHGRKRQYDSVNDVQVLELIDEIRRERRNNPIFYFETAEQISDQLRTQLSGIIRRSVEDMLAREHKIPINCFKLYWYRVDRSGARAARGGRGLTIEELSDSTGLPPSFLKRIETRKRVEDDPISPNTFHQCKLSDLELLEKHLQCPGELRAGQHDDFLTQYLIHYRRRTRNGTLRRDVRQLELEFSTRAIVFDFDGTLTTERNAGTTWERLWQAAGLTRDECADHHQRFRKKELSHREWCAFTRDRFRHARLTREQVNAVARSIELAPNTRRVLEDLKQKKVHLSILSGSIKSVIREALGDCYDLFDEVRANEIDFDDDGIVEDIIGTRFDFETKPDFIRELIRDRRLDPLDVLFVGNSVNDAWASRAGARTLCVNPIKTDPDNARNWTHSIEYMASLDQIMRFVSPSARH